ncbi:MAG: hypothetical protein ACYCVB_14985 [Bacilli bacterium]
MRNHLIRSAATVFIWIGGIEVVSSFVVRQLFNYDLTFTPYFFALGLLGLLMLVLARLV